MARVHQHYAVALVHFYQFVPHHVHRDALRYLCRSKAQRPTRRLVITRCYRRPVRCPILHRYSLFTLVAQRHRELRFLRPTIPFCHRYIVDRNRRVRFIIRYVQRRCPIGGCSIQLHQSADTGQCHYHRFTVLRYIIVLHRHFERLAGLPSRNHYLSTQARVIRLSRRCSTHVIAYRRSHLSRVAHRYAELPVRRWF